MMMAAVMAAAMAGQCPPGCEKKTGILIAYESLSGYVGIVAVGEDWERGIYSVVETGDGEMAGPEQSSGRMARVCLMYHEPPRIVGGMTPRDFAMATAQAAWVAESRRERPMPARNRNFAESLVWLGLDSPSLATRDAADRILRRMGIDAFDALTEGSRSPVATHGEVRERCRSILDGIRTGIPAE